MKIDTSKIEGYVSMTPEEKVAALEGFDTPDPDYSGYVKKETFDKTASELAALKKSSSTQLTEEQKKAQAANDKLTNLETELAALKKDKTISEYKAKYLAQGYAEDLAEDTAKAMADGDTAKVFANQQKFLSEYEKKLKADMLKGTSRPAAGAGTGGTDYDKMIENALASGDQISVAYYTRLKAEQEAANNK